MTRGKQMIVAALAALFLGLIVAPAAQAAGAANASTAPLAIDGYDPTLFFTRGTALRGKTTNVVEYEGATYRFRTKANKEQFAESPFRYLPQYDGYDAYGVFLGQVVKANPRL